MKRHHKQTRPDPNVADPLSEPSIHGRIRAAYLAAGFTRSTWADALGLTYQGVDLIDTGKTTPKLATLVKMQTLLLERSYLLTLDELVHGRHAPKLPHRSEQELSDVGVKALLMELGVGQDAMEALGVHAASPAGRFVRYTRTYCAAFVERYQLAREEGLDRPLAIEAAKTIAANAQANAEGVAQRVQPVSAPQLQALGRKLKADDERDTAARNKVVAAPVKKRRKRA